MSMNLIDELKKYRFPNGVGFRACRTFESQSIIFFCEDCERIGYFWHTPEYSELEMVTARFDYNQMVLSELCKHAELHNGLCKHFEKMLMRSFFVTSTAASSSEHIYYMPEEIGIAFPISKPRPKRMLRLRKIDIKTGEEV